MFKNRASMRTILLTQEPGYVESVDSNNIKTTGNRSCALYAYYQKKSGNEVVQLKVSDVSIRDDVLFYHGEPFDLKSFDGVVKRTWDGDKNSFKALELLKHIEKAGLYPDNPSIAIEKTLKKDLMQLTLEEAGCPTPKTFIYKDKSEIKDDVEQNINQLLELYHSKNYPRDFPAFVVKQQKGTHGNGIRMFMVDELAKMKDFMLQSNHPILLQEYIRPTMDVACQKKSSAHYRIIISDNGTEHSMIGATMLARDGSWVSNFHHKEGVLLYEKLIDIEQRLLSEIICTLTTAGKHCGIRQFGADVIIGTDNKFYVLELNDGMQISGAMFEQQNTPQQYASAFTSRLKSFLSQKSGRDNLSKKPNVAEHLVDDDTVPDTSMRPPN